MKVQTVSMCGFLRSFALTFASPSSFHPITTCHFPSLQSLLAARVSAFCHHTDAAPREHTSTSPPQPSMLTLVYDPSHPEVSISGGISTSSAIPLTPTSVWGEVSAHVIQQATSLTYVHLCISCWRNLLFHCLIINPLFFLT